MLEFMERASVKVLRKKGKSIKEISQTLGRDPKTIRRALEESADRQYDRGPRRSAADAFETQIRKWIDEGLNVKRMLELAQSATEKAYSGGKSAFYERVRQIRQAVDQAKAEAFVRFEGLPGEYLQVDWGEARLSFADGRRETCYFLCCRLKFSRFMYVELCPDMTLERLIRGLLRCFERLGGVPWVLVFDNMKTVTLGRDEQGRPIWNKGFKKFAAECDFAIELCARAAGNQKGAVENLVKYVKGNFLAGRIFAGRQDLEGQLQEWLEQVNGQVSQAHEQIPATVLCETERYKLCPIPAAVQDYGVLELLVATSESVVHVETNRYSVPVEHRGRTLMVRVHEQRVRIWADIQLIADHPRSLGRKQRVIDPKHFERVLERKPRARVMVYRDELVKLGGAVEELVEAICRRRRAVFGPEILRLYALLEVHGREELVAAVSLAVCEGVAAVEYVEAILELPRPTRRLEAVPVVGAPTQQEVDRDLCAYERFVRGRADR